MKCLDPGHTYILDHLDGIQKSLLDFVKREGEGYPGNIGHHEGTNVQEVLRVLIDRIKYVDKQIPHDTNRKILNHLRAALWNLEERAAERHGRKTPIMYYPCIELLPVCGKCGHIGCHGECH